MKHSIVLFRACGRYLKSRILEFPIWLGIPTLGLAASGSIPSLWELALFFLAIVFAAWHVLLLNDWAGLLRNPAETARFMRGESLTTVARSLLWTSVVLCTASIVLFGAIRKELALLAVIGTTISILYSHPRLHLKERPFGSPASHFLGGLVQFLLGYSLHEPIGARAVFLGVFFSIVLASGHFIHQGIDLDEDKHGHVDTFATRFGRTPSARIALALFVSSHAYLLALYTVGLTTLGETVIFTLPLVVHLVFGKRVLCDRNLPVAFLHRYQGAYRGAFALSTVMFIGARFC